MNQEPTAAPQPPTQPTPNPLVGVGGWLAFFCFILVALNPLLTLFSFFTIHKTIEALRTLNPEAAQVLDSFTSFSGVLSFTLAAFSVVAGILLIRRARNAVLIAKIYTAAVPTVALLALLPVFGSSASPELREGMVQGGVQDLIKSLGFFAIWFTYLSRSRRVKNTYATNA
ncbi:hypothetical protein LBMAG57_37210 [Verrucomicrobiota bacterium]|nr:hypothetical protein LBMAG57_37210 [Verrucomicrobiota bacterium]